MRTETLLPPPAPSASSPAPKPAFSSGSAGEAVVDPRVAALLPAQLLQPGEIIILLLKPSPLYVLLSSLASLSGIAIVILAALWFASLGFLPVTQTNLVILGLVLAGLRLLWGLLEWFSRVYVLTDRRIVRIRGVLRVHVFEAMLKNIQHTGAVFSVRERLFGLGTITFATSGTAWIEAAWEMIARPLEVHQTVVHALNRYR